MVFWSGWLLGHWSGHEPTQCILDVCSGLGLDAAFVSSAVSASCFADEKTSVRSEAASGANVGADPVQRLSLSAGVCVEVLDREGGGAVVRIGLLMGLHSEVEGAGRRVVQREFDEAGSQRDYERPSMGSRKLLHARRKHACCAPDDRVGCSVDRREG